MESLLSQQNRKSTMANYLNVWRQFNNFIMSLDVKPEKWEKKATLYITYLIDNGKQSSPVKSYIFAIKKLLVLDGYDWQDSEVLVTSLTKACRLINDKVSNRLPITCSLVKMLLFELERVYEGQMYLQILFKAIFLLCYYGMMQIGEVTLSPHIVKAKNIHIAKNKDKIMIVLYSSKTHGKGQRPQKIKISSQRDDKTEICT